MALLLTCKLKFIEYHSKIHFVTYDSTNNILSKILLDSCKIKIQDVVVQLQNATKMMICQYCMSSCQLTSNHFKFNFNGHESEIDLNIPKHRVYRLTSCTPSMHQQKQQQKHQVLDEHDLNPFLSVCQCGYHKQLYMTMSMRDSDVSRNATIKEAREVYIEGIVMYSH